jgi:signal transduction histidine kinase
MTQPDDPQTGLAALRPGDHVCGLFDGPDRQEDVVASFLREGLLRGEKVIYVADAATTDATLRRMATAGADVPSLVGGGDLELLRPEDVYSARGPFDPEAVITTLEETQAATLRAGYPSLRITADMSWSLDGKVDLDLVVEYEARLNRWYPGSQTLGLCQYGTPRFPAQVQLQVLATHPRALVNEVLHDNIYYMPPEEFLGPHRDDAMVLRWRSNLEQRRAADAERRRSAEAELLRERERALGVFKSRFIRRAGEELRKPLEPLVGHLERLGEPDMPPEAREAAAAARREADRLARVADDILAIVAADAGEVRLKPTTVDLTALAHEVAHAARAQGAAKDIQVVGGRSLAWGDVAHLRQAISDLVDVASARAQSHVRLLCGTLGSRDARLLVMHDGLPMADDETGRLFTPVRGDGGLFLARNIVEMHGGRLQAGAGGVSIELVLPTQARS